MKIPFLDLSRQATGLCEEINEAVSRVIERGSFILGEEVEKFESEWARFCQTTGAVGVANGTDAITLALTADGISAGDEVITTSLSAPYTVLGIINAGAKPVFADIDRQSLNLDPQQIEQLITPRTKAILPVHLYGQMADVNTILEIADRYKLIVIEDAAQAHGAKFDGKTCGTLSCAATFSFYPTKNLGALGDGGAIVSNDEDFLQKVKFLRQGGHAPALQSGLVGRNSRLDELQAAFLRIKLTRLAEWNLRRRQLADIYFARLSNLKRIVLPFVKNKAEHCFHLFVIRHPEREILKTFLFERGIETLVHYPLVLHRQKIFHDGSPVSLPVAEKAVEEILSLPLYPQMKESEIEAVCEAIAEFEALSSNLSHHANRR